MSGKTEKMNLSHVDATGRVRMVDVSAKAVTHREACASAIVRMTGEILDTLMQGTLPKGDALATARVAGILAAKRASEWIPLCHPLVLTWVRIEFERGGPQQLFIRCTAKTVAQTGVEMEAMTGAAVTGCTGSRQSRSTRSSRRLIGCVGAASTWSTSLWPTSSSPSWVRFCPRSIRKWSTGAVSH